MGLFNKLKNEFIDIIEWLDPSNDTIIHRFDRYQNEIKNGAKLTVRESQQAVFINEGELADVFKPGMYELKTENMPLLSTLKGWKYGFNSPFKAEVYFVNTKQFLDQKWGTKNPITLGDDRFGMFEVRAFGTFAYRVTDAGKFIKEVAGTDGQFTTEEINNQLRSIIVTRFTDAVGEGGVPVEKLASNLNEISELVMTKIKPEMEEYGVLITKFLLENISMPDDIKKEIFEYSRLDKINMQKLTQFKTAKAIENVSNQEGGAGGFMGAGLGFGMGQGMFNQMNQQNQQMNQNPQNFNNGGAGMPPPIPGVVKFFIAVNGQQQGPYEMGLMQQMVNAKQITPQTNVWREGMAAWAAAGTVPELMGLFNSVPPPLPPQ
ncbi:MAG TPA: SPFH domain-containing protein [Flavobacteriales bacterium]|nr:SPFH domain-containing protein [Flavobacteriales bacterium]